MKNNEISIIFTGLCDKSRHRITPFDPAVPGIGRAEVRTVKGTWGLICDDLWNDLDATVFCSCLGYVEYASPLLNIHDQFW